MPTTRVKLSEGTLLGHGVKSIFNGSRQPENYKITLFSVSKPSLIKWRTAQILTLQNKAKAGRGLWRSPGPVTFPKLLQSPVQSQSPLRLPRALTQTWVSKADGSTASLGNSWVSKHWPTHRGEFSRLHINSEFLFIYISRHPEICASTNTEKCIFQIIQ